MSEVPDQELSQSNQIEHQAWWRGELAANTQQSNSRVFLLLTTVNCMAQQYNNINALKTYTSSATSSISHLNVGMHAL